MENPGGNKYDCSQAAYSTRIRPLIPRRSGHPGQEATQDNIHLSFAIFFGRGGGYGAVIDAQNKRGITTEV